MADELLVDNDGTFQLLAEELPAFVAYLRDNHVPCDAEAKVVHAGGRVYGYGRLREPFSTEQTEALYRRWLMHPEHRIEEALPRD